MICFNFNYVSENVYAALGMVSICAVCQLGTVICFSLFCIKIQSAGIFVLLGEELQTSTSKLGIQTNLYFMWNGVSSNFDFIRKLVV